MLFDLRGRGRRRTVQAVYLGLAILIGGGLVLFGVGTGTGGGGLLNGIGGNGSGNQNQVVSSQEKSALKAVKKNPASSSAWSQLVQARWSAAGQGNNYNTATGTFTASGKKKLSGATQAWQRYLQLTKSPDPNLAVLAARAYAALGNYGGAAGAWEVETTADPNQLKGYECLAVSAYAAKQTRKGDLALGKALSLAPKAQRSLLKTQITAAKTQPTVAQQC
jgi:tetratricopeptide (TPR) repeat protein